MLFKVIDPNFVLSDKYRELPLETKATYAVVCAVANYKTGEFFCSLKYIAHHAGVCERAIQRSLRRLEDAEIITLIEERLGNTSVYRYNFPISVSKKPNFSETEEKPIPKTSPSSKDMAKSLPLFSIGGDSPVGRGVTGESGEWRLTSHPIEQNNEAQTLAMSIFTGSIPMPNKKEHNKIDLTTTFNKKLVAELVQKYGEDKVYENAVVIMRMEGIKNRDAYLRASLKGNYVPTNQKLVEHDETKFRELERDRIIEEKRRDWEEHTEKIRREADDPQVQERIKAELEKIKRMF